MMIFWKIKYILSQLFLKHFYKFYFTFINVKNFLIYLTK